MTGPECMPTRNSSTTPPVVEAAVDCRTPLMIWSAPSTASTACDGLRCGMPDTAM